MHLDFFNALFIFDFLYFFYYNIYKESKGENIELTRKQAEGLLISIDRYNAGKKYTVISGYASLDKTFLVEFV